MDQQHTGSCLCRTVTFKIDGAFERFFLCHCSHCRKDTGSAHAANLFSSVAKLEWLSGGENVQTYNLPSTRHTRCFCSVCGSAMPHVGHEFVVVPAGCLDTDLTMTPDAHIFSGSKAAWDKNLASIQEFDTFPQSGP
ncbi:MULTISPECIES: GFA family protein [unclassified Pseudoxanthomonas]|uniref:GFA family protein n=1 Tax=unclassified Pseudoxanthomonas TaxID=2645906 RepID=UPI00307DA1BD